jgi:hypothetical protein
MIMKKILMWGTWGIMAVSIAACGGSGKKMSSSAAILPEEVVSSFNQKYPYATDVHWNMDDGLYEAKFKDYGNVKKEAEFRSDGALIKVDN